MKKTCLILVIALSLAVSSSAEKLSALFAYSVFNQPSGSPFIETYLSVTGRTVNFSPNSGGKLQGKIEVQWVLKKDSAIIAFDKYNLLSPELASSSDAKPDFMDQQRIAASEGIYSLELSITDKNSSEQGVSIKQPITVRFAEDRITISDIELVESYRKSDAGGKFSKSGYEVLPFVSSFYHEGIKGISFYAEIYNAKKYLGEEDFLISYKIFNDGNKSTANDLVFYKKQKAQDVNILLASIPIDNLTSGNYNIGIEVRDKKNQLVAHKSLFFQRSNPLRQPIAVNDDYATINTENTFVANYTNVDSLKMYLDCLYPISSVNERNIADNQISIKNVKSMQQFLYYFWSKRDNIAPEQKWYVYKAEVEKTNAAYSTHNKKGYETDRGRVYLQYGPPNSMERDDMSTDSYPYEIWHYYTVGTQSNRKFVFYSRERSSNNYELLHSDVTGEVYMADWQLRLHERTNKYGDLDAEKAPASYGDRSQDSFNNPK
jgi:GWxTD domain-containing protein